MFRTASLCLLLATCLVTQGMVIPAAAQSSSRRTVVDKNVRRTQAATAVPVPAKAQELPEVPPPPPPPPIDSGDASTAETEPAPVATSDAADSPESSESVDTSSETSTAEAPAAAPTRVTPADEEPPLDSVDPPVLTEPQRQPSTRAVPPVVPPPPAPIQPPANRLAPVPPAPAPNRFPPAATPPLPPPAESSDDQMEDEDEQSASDAPETVATPDANNYNKAHFRSDLHTFLHGCCLPGFYAGFEMTFLAPLDDPCPVVTMSDLISGDTYTSDVGPGLGIGFRTWAGFQNPNAFGFRVSYWNLGSHMTNPDPVVPTMDKTATLGAYYLNAQTLYFELLNSFCCGHGGFLDVSFGAAYARMERNATAVGYGQVGEGEAIVKLYGLANCADSIEGMGFTGSIGGRHRFCCGCENIDELGNACGPGGWNFFWNVRGTVLWAGSQIYGRTEAHAFTQKFGGSTAYTTNSAYACTDGDIIGIGEMQIGVAYSRCLSCCPGILTMRFALEGQYWGNAPISAVSDSTAYLVGGPPLFGGEVNSQVNAEAGGLSLLGLTFGVCLSF